MPDDFASRTPPRPAKPKRPARPRKQASPPEQLAILERVHPELLRKKKLDG